MGMYTELVLGVNLHGGTPQPVLDILRVMIGESETIPEPLPDHPLFKCDRWRMVGCCGSYYFAGGTISRLHFDEIGQFWELSIRSNLKNYGGEIEHFCDWLRPYISKPDNGEFMGYSRYEEAQGPTLLYNRKAVWG